MCGISFAFRPGLEPGKLHELMSRSVSRLAHRGPDGIGQTVEGGWAMGNRRLAVIDLPGSAQPLSDNRGRYHLTYNGELYNYRELRERLKSSWDFRTLGDTEVVLAGLVTYGDKFLQLMEGMWAIALWDAQNEELFLARDRMGKRPLYFQSDNRQFACASELPALETLSWFGWQEDPRSTADYLRYGYYLPGTTAYRKVREVLPGHWLRWSPGRESIEDAYWKLRSGGFAGNRRQACDMLKDAMYQSVKHRLVADVEVGVLLSGGIDSSLVTAIVTGLFRKNVKSFSIGFNESAYDERSSARSMAKHCHTTHFDDSLTLKEVFGKIDSVLGWAGQPFADGSILPTAAVCGLAAKHLKVVLSGDGGDELFSGYPRYMVRALLRWYTRLPLALRAVARSRVDAFPQSLQHNFSIIYKNAKLFIDIADRMAGETPYVAPTNYTEYDLQSLIPDLWRLGHVPPRLPETTDMDDLHRMMVADACVYLPQDILSKVDRASMAHSLEVRAPFLDRKVVELAFSLHRKWHRVGWIGKRMLRDAFKDLLPMWAWQRPKHGFGIPVHSWFREGLEGRLKLLLEQTIHPLNVRMVRQMLADHLSGRRDHGQRLWQLFIYLLWRVDRSWQMS